MSYHIWSSDDDYEKLINILDNERKTFKYDSNREQITSDKHQLSILKHLSKNPKDISEIELYFRKLMFSYTPETKLYILLNYVNIIVMRNTVIQTNCANLIVSSQNINHLKMARYQNKSLKNFDC
jgi:hypothetical protein